jgi:hypothetical protein
MMVLLIYPKVRLRVFFLRSQEAKELLDWLEQQGCPGPPVFKAL